MPIVYRECQGYMYYYFRPLYKQQDYETVIRVRTRALNKVSFM